VENYCNPLIEEGEPVFIIYNSL